MSCCAIIVAAGRSRRMGFDKLMAPLAGKPVLQWSLDAFLACELVTRVVVVTDEERFAQLETGSEKEIVRVDGDRERYLSVANGLKAVPGKPMFVAIHDGARPLVKPEQITDCIGHARETGAAALARRVTETIKKGTRDGFSRGSVPREELWFAETPQIFRPKLIARAYQQVMARRMPITDDVSAADALGIATKLVENNLPNLKVTVLGDLLVAEAILKARLG
jgi:2-C-methyl-D-erythritol 4-phosphate cytidylyltransferase